MNKYFAVLWRLKELAMFEWSVWWFAPQQVWNDCVVIDVADEQVDRLHDFFQHLGWSVKRWRVVTAEELWEILKHGTLLGVTDTALWAFCKKNYGVKRFKKLAIHHTDKEIKEWWIELIALWYELYGHVEHYQHIPLYEAIDFEKPVRGMQIGMMPAKLTHQLISIACAHLSLHWSPVTIYDPFCGFGTTWFVANALGYNTICSDINPTPTKQNLPRRNNQLFATDALFTVFKHDVMQPFVAPFLQHVSCIVTEWRLGPIMAKKSVQNLTRQQLQEKITDIQTMYTTFLSNIAAHPHCSTVPIVITYPQWTFFEADMSLWFIEHAETLWYTVQQPSQLYMRNDQQVARRVFVLQRG